MKTLTDIIYQYRNAEFSWDKFDCCTFSAKVVSEYKGVDITNFREIEDFKDYKGMIRWLAKMKCKELADAPSAFLNVERKPISEVKLGDIVYFVSEQGEGIFGVCNGCRAYFLQQGKGLVTRNIKDCKYCWSVN